MHELEQPENNSAPPKQTKLRESCDSCLIAKVKCSKARPVCSRCLANGAACGYSPSSRAGRKNRNATANKPARLPTRYEDASEPAESGPPTPTSYLPLMHTMLDQHDHSVLHSNENMFSGSGPVVSPNSSRRHSVMENGGSATKEEGLDISELFHTTPFTEEFGESLLQFSPQPYFQDFSPATPSPHTSTSNALAGPAWTGHEGSYSALPSFQLPADLVSFSQHSPPSHSDPTQETLNTHDNGHMRPPDTASKYGCDCFAVCLQALQTLHNHSHLPASTQLGELPFDVVLTINREAMVGCAAMLDCAKCVSKSGSSISTMLLATIFGKIISLYGAACFLRFGPTTGSQTMVKLAFGAYTLTGEDRRLLEMEIILLELRKVESILTTYHERFRNAQAEVDETSVYNALTNYLDKNLHYILNFLQMRKGGTCK